MRFLSIMRPIPVESHLLAKCLLEIGIFLASDKVTPKGRCDVL